MSKLGQVDVHDCWRLLLLFKQQSTYACELKGPVAGVRIFIFIFLIIPPSSSIKFELFNNLCLLNMSNVSVDEKSGLQTFLYSTQTFYTSSAFPVHLTNMAAVNETQSEPNGM